MPLSIQFWPVFAIIVGALYYLYQVRRDYSKTLKEIRNTSVECVNGEVTLEKVLSREFSTLVLYFYLGKFTTLVYFISLVSLLVLVFETSLIISGEVDQSTQLHKYSLASTFLSLVLCMGVTVAFNSLSDKV